AYHAGAWETAVAAPAWPAASKGANRPCTSPQKVRRVQLDHGRTESRVVRYAVRVALYVGQESHVTHHRFLLAQPIEYAPSAARAIATLSARSQLRPIRVVRSSFGSSSILPVGAGR